MVKSIEEIQKMLDDLKKEEDFLKNNAPAVPEEEPEEDNRFCIRNGAYVRVSEDGM